MPTKTQYTPTELKKAYQIVTEHLAHELIKASPDQSVRLGKLGSFKKKENQMTSYLKKKTGQKYVYYRLLFKPFSKLKLELNRTLEKKYNR